jgi:hypothetical protein
MLQLPLHGFLSLFIHVLKFPGSPSARSDLALLDVAVGHFGLIDFITDMKLDFSSVRDIATLARNVVDATAPSL